MRHICIHGKVQYINNQSVFRGDKRRKGLHNWGWDIYKLLREVPLALPFWIEWARCVRLPRWRCLSLRWPPFTAVRRRDDAGLSGAELAVALEWFAGEARKPLPPTSTTEGWVWNVGGEATAAAAAVDWIIMMLALTFASRSLYAL